MTNGDAIRSLNDAELTDFVAFIEYCKHQGDPLEEYSIEDFKTIQRSKLLGECDFDLYQWLKSEVT